MCLGYDPTITNSVWLVKVAIRSRRQSIWVTYTSRRYTAFYTGFRCMLQLYIDLALSRLARHAIQPIQLYSYTRYTAYSTIQPPSAYFTVAVKNAAFITFMRLACLPYARAPELFEAPSWQCIWPNYKSASCRRSLPIRKGGGSRDVVVGLG